MDFLDGGDWATDPYSFPYPDDSGMGNQAVDMPSELGGSLGDWNAANTQDQTDYTLPEGQSGAYGSDESGPVAGPDLTFPGLPGADPSGWLSGIGRINEALGLHTDGSGDAGGGTMGDFDVSGALVPFGGRGIPWGAMTRQVGAAARYFGPALLMPIVQTVANYWTALLQKRGLSITITPGALLMKFLAKKGRGRRRGGITARQLSITSRTIGKVERMHQKLRAVCGRAGVNRGSSHRYFPRRRHARR